VRGRVQLDREHPGVGHLVGDGSGDRTGPRAQVDDDRPVDLAGAVDRPAGQQLGLGPRHEHTRADRQLDVPEAGDAEQVLERLAPLATGEQGLELLGLRVGHLADDGQGAPLDAEHVGQQRVGVVLG
jgi:hypothetical protein